MVDMYQINIVTTCFGH